MLLTEARRAARTTAGGELVPLDEQDRSLWDRELIAEGVELARVASSKRSAGEYLIQAQIAALHDTAARSQDTDWRRIAGLYAVLEQMTSNPIVSLNGAIAVAMFEGPETGLALLAPLEQPLASHHRLHAVRGHLLEMAGELDAAFAEYEIAANRTTNLRAGLPDDEGRPGERTPHRKPGQLRAESERDGPALSAVRIPRRASEACQAVRQRTCRACHRVWKGSSAFGGCRRLAHMSTSESGRRTARNCGRSIDDGVAKRKSGERNRAAE